MNAIVNNDAGKEPEQPEAAAQSDTPNTPGTKRVRIVCGSGTVNIRMGNGTQYERITAVPNGTSFEWIATAENARVGWASGKYSKTA